MVDKLVNSKANYNRIKRTEECFGSLGKPLVIPGRVLIGEGILKKMCRKGPKERIFFLFNDVLVYGNILVNKKLYNKQHIIPLEDVKLESIKNKGEYENGWVIKTSKKSFAVYSATAQEKKDWMLFIQRCIDELLHKSNKQESKTFAAVWIPDMEAEICMCCKKTQFTLINRRHHCRNCGIVVCGPCSNKKYFLANHSTKPVRVCEVCSVRLTKLEFEANLQNSELPVVCLSRAPVSPPDSQSEDDTEHNNRSDRLRPHRSNCNQTEKRQSIFYGHSSENIAESYLHNQNEED